MVYWEPIMSLTQDSQAHEPNFGGHLSLAQDIWYTTWSNAVRSMLLRYCMANMYITARVSRLVPEGTTMWQFQWELMEMLVPFVKK